MDKKGILGWSSAVDYTEAGIVLGSDGEVYKWVATSGPAGVGAKDPTIGDPSYWLPLKAALSQDIVGPSENLECSITAASASATFTDNQIIVATSLSGISYRLTGFNEVVNLASVGAGGMDTGAAPVSGYVAVYAIYNPVTGDLASLAKNATLAEQPSVYGGANMPSGYTASALLTVVPTNGSGQFSPAFVAGRNVWIPDNVFYTSATQQASLFIRDLSAVVPLNAKSGDFSTTISSSSATVSVLTGLAGSAAVAAGIGIGEKRCALTSAAIGGAGFQAHFPNIPIITPQTLYYRCTVAAGTMSFSITCSGYKI
jgi:hypothetical protein